MKLTSTICCHRLRKLVALVSLAYACCLSVGMLTNQELRSIARKNHSYRPTSLSWYKLNLLRQLTCPDPCLYQPLARLVKRLADWLVKQLFSIQITKVIG